jgi:hypothetical protein
MAGQLSLASSLLAGFAFTGAVSVLSLKEVGQLYTSTLVFFLLSAILLLSSTLAFIFMSIAGLNALPLIKAQTVALVSWASYARKRMLMPIGLAVFTLGLLAFLIAIAITGWLYSPLVGIISVGAAALGLILAVFIFFLSISDYTASADEIDKSIQHLDPS